MGIALIPRRFSPILALGIAWVVCLTQVLIDIPPNASNLAVLAILYATAAYGTPAVRWIGFASTFVGAFVVAASIALPRVLDDLVVGDVSNVLNLGNALAAALLVFFATLVAFLLSWTSGLLVSTWLRARDSRRAALLAEQEVAAEQERTRIARDMHDVVAHSLAVVVAQADGARYIASKDPAATEAALVTISATAREALSDVRVLLAQLRHSQGDGPQRTLVDLERLFEQLRAAGLTIAEEASGEPLPLGTAQQLAVYRIVQESLTNALRHADVREPVTVHFGWTPHGLNLAVASALKPPTGSHRRDQDRCHVDGAWPRGHDRACSAGRWSSDRGTRRRAVHRARLAARASRTTGRPRDHGDHRMTSTIRVALVDDQALFRTGIRMLVDSQPDLAFVGEAGNGRDGIDLVHATRPDVVLMDIRMPVMDGIEATERIVAEADARTAPVPRVIVLTTFDLDEAAIRAIRGGASGFLLKDSDPEFLLASIRAVHAGTAVVAPSATRELFRHFDSRAATVPEPEAFGTLTAREREVFVLAAQGLSNSEIAKNEFLSEATVKTHISRILSKLTLRDRVQLVVYAFEHRLTD